jgi:uncharacterized coiled-coil protein SlyX
VAEKSNSAVESNDSTALAQTLSLNERVIALEEKLCFQDELLDVLNQQLSQQQITLLSLALRVQQLLDSVQSLSNGAGQSGSTTGVNEPPPHY